MAGEKKPAARRQGFTRAGQALVTAAVTLLALGHPPPAAAAGPAACVGGERDSRGRSSVDAGEIAWEDETKYDDARRWALKAWTGRGMRIRLPADDSTRIADLEFTDVRRTDGRWNNTGGAWIGLPGTDTLALNSAYVGKGKRLGNTSARRRIASHELGHALGFCHKDPARYPTLMARRLAEGPANGKPTSRDRRNYTALWG
ncbi:hypothetical protein [Streptomyces sp. CAU 1734]|uniref:hypothetical protein n=1 Tax=Streptomyces sp. CAU 1734 TaxID=3140360 RepID=UPI00326145D1